MANKKVIRATADYTGGGIYILTGALQDGTFFMADSPYCVDIYDADPEKAGDDAFTNKWHEAHSVTGYVGPIVDRIIGEALAWLEDNAPGGNYIMSEVRGCFERIG